MSTTYLKVLSAQELLDEIPAILFVGVSVVDCEERLVVIGFRTTLSLGWARSTRTCTTFAIFLAMFGAQSPWSSSVCSVPRLRACVYSLASLQEHSTGESTKLYRQPVRLTKTGFSSS